MTKLNKLSSYTEITDDMEKNGFTMVKRSLGNGYVSRKAFEGNAAYAEEYKGIYGNGFKVKRPNHESTRYCWIEYWIYLERE